MLHCTLRHPTVRGDGCCIPSFYMSSFYLSCSFVLKLDCVAGTPYGLSTPTWHKKCDSQPCFGFGGMFPVNNNRNLNRLQRIEMRIEIEFAVPILPLDIAVCWFCLENPGSPMKNAMGHVLRLNGRTDCGLCQ